MIFGVKEMKITVSIQCTLLFFYVFIMVNINL